MDCGVEDLKSFDNLKSGKSSKCISCSKRKIPKEYSYLVNRYQAARQRCVNPNDAGYPDYGARGIEFRFSSALEYINYVISLPGADRRKEIDRIDNNGHYEIGNLRWATRAEQTLNTRRTRRVYYNGVEILWSDFVKDFTDISISRADILLTRGYSLQEITEYVPANVGRRIQNIRLGKLRT